ncbi:hypothetical protein [Streptomyces sp. NPDC050504]|uniref:hypothetical protein n=1 Tax=Streptomyces sp. NPDC050504 TaxID=3365618 RepID=UPI0037BB8B1A
MKPMKVAAVVAGSVMALGAAAPAMAADAVAPASLTPTSLTGAVDTLSSHMDADMIQSDLTDAPVVGDVKQTAESLGSTGSAVPLLGGLPLS